MSLGIFSRSLGKMHTVSKKASLPKRLLGQGSPKSLLVPCLHFL